MKIHSIFPFKSSWISLSCGCFATAPTHLPLCISELRKKKSNKTDVPPHPVFIQAVSGFRHTHFSLHSWLHWDFADVFRSKCVFVCYRRAWHCKTNECACVRACACVCVFVCHPEIKQTSLGLLTCLRFWLKLWLVHSSGCAEALLQDPLLPYFLISLFHNSQWNRKLFIWNEQ